MGFKADQRKVQRCWVNQPVQVKGGVSVKGVLVWKSLALVSSQLHGTLRYHAGMIR